MQSFHLFNEDKAKGSLYFHPAVRVHSGYKVHVLRRAAEAEHIVVFIYSVVVALHSLAFHPHKEEHEGSGYSDHT